MQNGFQSGNYRYEPLIGVNERIVAANLLNYRETLNDLALRMAMVRYYVIWKNNIDLFAELPSLTVRSDH